MKIHRIDLQYNHNSSGSIVIADAQKNIPFEIKRVYCLYSLGEERRGFHAHKQLQQVMVCLAGQCKVLLDDGHEKNTSNLSVGSPGLFIDKMVWREMFDFSKDCVLMVLASDWYDEADYIRDYDMFIQRASKA